MPKDLRSRLAELNSTLPWALPLLGLIAISVSFAAVLSRMTDGREVTDDGFLLLYLVRHPLFIWDSYETNYLGRQWGSFPPLFPLFFGALVKPWTQVASNFWALRLGVLTWACVVLVSLSYLLTHVERVPTSRVRSALWLLVLVPSAWASCAFQPQEEIYVSLFVLALYLAARSERWKFVPYLLILTALAAKYFVLILLLPLAFASPRPWRNAAVWGSAVLITLAAYVGYHYVLHGLTPILDYRRGPSDGISLWSLLWSAGFHPSKRAASVAGILVAGSLGLLLALQSRRTRVPIAFSMAATLYATLLTISATFPAYELWAVPLVLVCFTQMRERWARWSTGALLFAWGIGEWGVNLFRGVGLALATDRGVAKTAFATKIEPILGADFPYAGAHIACLVLVIAAGIGMVGLLCVTGYREANAASSRAAPQPEFP